MATLFDLAQQYLNRALPETFRYDRTNQPGIPTPVPTPVVPEPIKKILPVQGGSGDGYSVYNPDPNSISNKNYSPYAYRQAAERNLIGTMGGALTGTQIPNTSTEVAKLMDMYPDYYTGPQLKGIPGAIQGYLKNNLAVKLIGNVVGGIENLLPVNKTGILQNELLGAGFQLNNIGQIVGDPRTVEGVMAGMNTSKMDAGSFDKKSAGIEKTLSGKYGLSKSEIDSIKAGNITDSIKAKAYNKTMGTTTNLVQDLLNTQIAKDKFLDAMNKTDIVFDDKSKQKDPDYVSFDDQLDINNIINQEKEDDENSEIPSFLTDNSIIGPTGISNTTFPGMGTITPIGPTYGGLDSIGSGGGITFAPTTPKTLGSVLADKKINTIKDYIDINPGGGKDTGPSTPPSKTPDYSNVTTAKGPPGKISKPTANTSLIDAAASYQIQPSNNSGNSSGGCFLKGTLITMFDGSTKPVEQVDLGNEVAIGGKVFATGKFLVKNLHDYKGIKVSGSHMVSENNKWVRVEDSEHGKLLGNEEHTVYVFGSENRRILINDILFTDYFEVNEQDKLMNNEEDFFDNWKLYAKQDSGNNVDIINAS